MLFNKGVIFISPRKIRHLIVIFSTFFLIASTYADCPSTDRVKYGCIVIAGHKHCNWSAPWYEGFPEEGAESHEVAASFSHVYWGAKSNNPNPGEIGSSVCFYQSVRGHLIELVQNNWGGVIYPEGFLWVDGVWQGHKGRECGYGLNPAQCHFNYPNGS